MAADSQDIYRNLSADDHEAAPIIVLGLAADDEVEATEEEENNGETNPTPQFQSYEDAKNEVLHFPTDCPNCRVPTVVNMKPTDIPFFQTVIIMSLMCDNCGYKSNEVKSGGAIRDQGCRMTISIEKDIDLARDVLKSDTCSMRIPEIDLEVGGAALSGRFTTIEGLLTATKEQLDARSSFFMGDSAESEDKKEVTNFLTRLDDIISLRMPARIVLDDPTGCSYVQSLAPLDDSRLKKEFYTRSYEQDDELGLNDMKVENYGELDIVEEQEETEEIQQIIYDIQRYKSNLLGHLNENDTLIACELSFLCAKYVLKQIVKRIENQTGILIVPNGMNDAWDYRRLFKLANVLATEFPNFKTEILDGLNQAFVFHIDGGCNNKLPVSSVRRGIPIVFKFVDTIEALPITEQLAKII